jgi:hypothetical protein
MTLSQLHLLKRWHLHHGARPVELTVCDLVIGAWLCGWMLMPSLLLLGAWAWLPASLGMVFLPDSYHALRARLHRRGVLRCDWLPAVQRHR